jgi:putative ATP-binding cassette transporter
VKSGSLPAARTRHAGTVKIWRILARYAGWRLVLAVAGGIAAGAALAALMRLIHRAITLSAAETPAALLQFLGLLAVYFFGNIASQHTLSDAAERLQWQLRLKLLRQVLASPLRQLERHGLSRLFNVLSNDVRTLSDYLCGLPDVVINATIALGCFGYMAWLSPGVFLFNLLFVALAAACYLVPERHAQRVGHRAAAAHDVHIGHLHYALQAIRSLLQSRPRRTDFVEQHFTVSGSTVRHLNRQSRLIHLLAERFAEVMVLGNVACLLFALPRLIDLPTSTATGVLLAAIFVRQPLKDSLAFFAQTQRARVAIERMEQVGLDPFAPEVTPEAAPPVPPGTFREVAFHEVNFRYESDHGQPGFASGPFSLRVRSGEILFLIGGNGAGKTTLAKLLCGLYPPESGTVTVDTTPVINDADRAAQRALFTAVFTDDPLFSHVLGVPAAEAARRGPGLLETLQLAGKVALNGAAFSTTDLSQGQRRRLVLMTALLEDRPILLLDEWAADQDPAFRAYFYETLIPDLRARGRTLVLITHDDRYFHLADRLVKIDGGQIRPDSGPAVAPDAGGWKN